MVKTGQFTTKCKDRFRGYVGSLQGFRSSDAPNCVILHRNSCRPYNSVSTTVLHCDCLNWCKFPTFPGFLGQWSPWMWQKITTRKLNSTGRTYTNENNSASLRISQWSFSPRRITILHSSQSNLEEAHTHKSAKTHAGTVFETGDLDLLTPK